MWYSMPYSGEVGMKTIFVEVMSSGNALKRFSKAWRAAAGVDASDTVIGVGSIAELTALLTPKRLELLRYVALNPDLSIRALGQALGRDYKNVHTDVCELESRQLLVRKKDGSLSAPYDEIIIRAPLKKAA
jgi:predicted transcriptional regulator